MKDIRFIKYIIFAGIISMFASCSNLETVNVNNSIKFDVSPVVSFARNLTETENTANLDVVITLKAGNKTETKSISVARDYSTEVEPVVFTDIDDGVNAEVSIEVVDKTQKDVVDKVVYAKGSGSCLVSAEKDNNLDVSLSVNTVYTLNFYTEGGANAGENGYELKTYSFSDESTIYFVPKIEANYDWRNCIIEESNPVVRKGFTKFTEKQISGKILKEYADNNGIVNLVSPVGDQVGWNGAFVDDSDISSGILLYENNDGKTEIWSSYSLPKTGEPVTDKKLTFDSKFFWFDENGLLNIIAGNIFQYDIQAENPADTFKAMKDAGEICRKDFYSYDVPGTALYGFKKLKNENKYEVSVWDNLSYTSDYNDAFVGTLENLEADDEVLSIKAYKRSLYCFVKKADGSVWIKRYTLSVDEDYVLYVEQKTQKEVFAASENVTGIADTFARTENSAVGKLYVIAETAAGNGLFSLSLEEQTFADANTLISFTDALNPAAFIGIRPGYLIISDKQGNSGNQVLEYILDNGIIGELYTNATFMIR